MGEKNGDFGAFLAGFLIGGLVGASAALLLAPQSGDETRTLIRDKGIELYDQMEQSVRDTYTKAEKFTEDAIARGDDLQRRGRVILEEQKEAVEEAAKKARKSTAKKKKPKAEEEPKE